MTASTLATRLLAWLAERKPANVVLMRLAMDAASPAALAQCLREAAALDPADDSALAEVAALHHRLPDAWHRVRAAIDRVDHAPRLAEPAAALDHWREAFDRLADTAPEAGVALYALGDADLLRATTAEVVDHLARWGLLGPDRDALDLGCGLGRFADAMAPHLRSVLGLDLSPGMIAEARRRSKAANVRYLLGSGRDLAPAADASCDLILAADVFPYLIEAGLAENHVAEAARVLRPGGTLVILNYSYRDTPEHDLIELSALASARGLTSARLGTPFALWDATVDLLRKAGGTAGASYSVKTG